MQMSSDNLTKKITEVPNLTNVRLVHGNDNIQFSKKITAVPNLTNVPLVHGDDNSQSRKDVIYACTICDKSYDKRSSFNSHMRIKHRNNKESDLEKGTKTTQKNRGQAFSQWIENELDRPLLQTRELDSFLANRSDEDLVAAARELMDSNEANVQVEKLVVLDHEVDWFEENNLEFSDEFASQFASYLRRESLPQSQAANGVAEFHNELMKKQQEKYDSMIVKTTKMLNATEKTKASLRKTIKSLQTELEETRENWQGTAEADAEQISSLKAKVTEQKLKIEELVLKESEPEISKSVKHVDL